VEQAVGREVEIHVGAGERALPGLLSLPAGEGPFPGLALVHGSGPNDRDETIGPNRPFRELAQGLSRRGVAVLRYDKRSFARPADLTALGDRLTVREEVIDDARAALDLLRARPEIDAGRVYLLGHSLGGTLAPRIAEASPPVAGMIILAGMTLPLPEKIQEQARYIATVDGELSDVESVQLAALEFQITRLRAALDGDRPPPSGSILGAPFAYYRDLERHDPPAVAAALGLPVLVLQGKRDYQVTMEDFRRWEEALAGRPYACLVAYDDLDHLFRSGTGRSRPQDYERAVPLASRVIEDIAAWIRDRRCPV
jgi:alpha-beta hydrolase superfamily lysophospholipase